MSKQASILSCSHWEENKRRIWWKSTVLYTLEFAIKWADVLPWMALRNLNSFNIKRSSFSTRLSSAQKPLSCEFYYPASLFCTLSLARALDFDDERTSAALGADKTWLSRERVNSTRINEVWRSAERLNSHSLPLQRSLESAAEDYYSSKSVARY